MLVMDAQVAALVARTLGCARSKTRAAQRVRGKPLAAAVAGLAAGLKEAVQCGRKVHEERSDVAVFALNTGLAHLISLVSVVPAALMRQLRDAMGSADELSPTPPRKLLRRAAKGGFKHALLNFVVQVTRRPHPSKRSSARHATRHTKRAKTDPWALNRPLTTELLGWTGVVRGQAGGGAAGGGGGGGGGGRAAVSPPPGRHGGRGGRPQRHDGHPD
eukprot:1195663-Prorocentrum_minimum.AAC.11